MLPSNLFCNRLAASGAADLFKRIDVIGVKPVDTLLIPCAAGHQGAEDVFAGSDETVCNEWRDVLSNSKQNQAVLL